MPTSSRPGCGRVLTAHKGFTWLALAASVPFTRCSCGYVGTTDGWQDVSKNLRMDWEFDCAPDGNVALIGELDLRQNAGVRAGACLRRQHAPRVSHGGAGAGHCRSPVTARVSSSNGTRFAKHLLPGKETAAGDGGHLYRSAKR